MTDAVHRELAIDPSASYTVTAPAGSGKTELLSQRFLALLSVVSSPEEILAITFTRKAVAEMRERIISALEAANKLSPEQLETEPPHRRQTLELAQRALNQDKHLGWMILENPSRLRIYTFDAFSSSIVRQLPLASRFGGSPRQSDDPLASYQSAVSSTLRLTDSNSSIGSAVTILLRHLDCRVDRLHDLLCDILSNRDQWRFVFYQLESEGDDQGSAFERLEEDLRERIKSVLNDCRSCLLPYRETLTTLLNFSRDNLGSIVADNCAIKTGHLPEPDNDFLSEWRELAKFLLTATGSFRATVDKRQGFPPKSTKPLYSVNDFKALITLLREDVPQLEDLLNEALLLPVAEKLLDQKPLINALLTVVRHAMAFLELEFQSRQEVDFVATGVQSLVAMQELSDIAMKLDHQIKHVLVDEFQDTSQVQYDLLQSLCREWATDPEAGRSLFLVGDAMQSIYAFRNARVGLFMHARKFGLANVSMQSLTLNSNFRSHPHVLEWINHCFERIFPTQDDLANGAAAYVNSVSARSAEELNCGAEVFEYELEDFGREREAAHICEQIKRVRASEPNSTVAVLVRTRKQAESLYPFLRARGINWQATDFESLSSEPVIVDLMTVTRLILQNASIISWFAILRSPLVGLNLSDLLLVAQPRLRSGFEAVQAAFNNPQLSTEGRERLANLLRQYKHFMRSRERGSLPADVRGLWRALGGELYYSDQQSRDATEKYYSELLRVELVNRPVCWEHVQAATDKLYATSAQNDENPVQIMTIHKAKGLEFDTVILPSLDRNARPDSTELLNWLDGVNSVGEASMIVGLYQPGKQSEPNCYQYIRALKKERQRHESARLLYVACTRAAKRLLLYRGYRVVKDSIKPSSSSSLASLIWPHLPVAAIDISNYQIDVEDSEQSAERYVDHEYHSRLSFTAYKQLALTMVKDIGDLNLANTVDTYPTSEDGFFDPSADDLSSSGNLRKLAERSIGTVVHRELQAWQQDRGLRALAMEKNHSRRLQLWQTQLRQLGLRQSLDEAVDWVRRAVMAAKDDRENAWLFDSELNDDESELELRINIDGQLKSICLDRTFIDNDGRRWIVDYKVHLASDADLPVLHKMAQAHRPQLDSYAGGFDAECTLAVYYPLQSQLIILE
ncbi:MAG: UvrD-helicase domain-containing protein [Pseudomonadales bacterium]